MSKKIDPEKHPTIVNEGIVMVPFAWNAKDHDELNIGGVIYIRVDKVIEGENASYQRGKSFAEGAGHVNPFKNVVSDPHADGSTRPVFAGTPEGSIFEKIRESTLDYELPQPDEDSETVIKDIKRISSNKREEILLTAEHLINGDRAQTYGAPEVSFGRIADLWNAMGLQKKVPATNGMWGQPLDAVDVALALIQLKVSRVISSPDHEDSWIDIAGYAGLGGEMATKEKN